MAVCLDLILARMMCHVYVYVCPKIDLYVESLLECTKSRPSWNREGQGGGLFGPDFGLNVL